MARRPNHWEKEGETMEMEAKELVERLEAAATLMERTLAWLDGRQRTIAGEVERFHQRQRTVNVAPAIVALQMHAEAVRQAEMERAAKQLGRGGG